MLRSQETRCASQQESAWLRVDQGVTVRALGWIFCIYLPLAIDLSRWRSADPDRRLFRRRRGNYHWLDIAAVRTYKLRGKRLIDRHVHRRPSSGPRDRRVACPVEVPRIGQLKVDVTLGGQTRAVTCGVIGDAVSSLDFVGDAALRSRDRLVSRRQIIAKRRPGGETRLPRNRCSMVYAYMRLPEAGFDWKIGKLRRQGRRPEQQNGCSAQTYEVRVFPRLHEDAPRSMAGPVSEE